MFCAQCGTKIEDDSTFCHNCGTKVEQTQNKKIGLENNKNLQKQSAIVDGDENKRKKKLIGTVVTVVVAIVCIVFLINTYGPSKAPNEADIKSAVVEYNMLEFSQEYTPDFYGQPILMNNIDNVQINGQQTEEKKNITYCTIEMSNDSCKVSMNCNFNFSYYDDKKWYPQRIEMESFFFSPVKGIDELQAYDIAVENLHVEPQTIEGGYLGEDYTYDSTYNLQLKEHETDLVNNIDKIIYDYYKATDFCTESGLVEIYYIFNTANGNWEYAEMLNDDISYEYYPEGQWRFDISTHYYRINITNVDYVNNTASIYYRDSIWQSEADSGELTNYAEVSFTITEEGMQFSPFHVVTGKGIFAREQDVYLFLKKDNMYFSSNGSGYSRVQWSRYIE